MTHSTYITIDNISLYVEYEYEPEEREVLYDSNLEGHPGSPERVYIEKVLFRGFDVTNELRKYDLEMDWIEEAVLNDRRMEDIGW